MTEEQTERIKTIRAATDKMKANIRDRFEYLRKATEDELIEHCIFIEGILAGNEALRADYVKTKDSLRSAITQLGDLRERLVDMATKKKK
jgi:hypothetical protein